LGRWLKTRKSVSGSPRWARRGQSGPGGKSKGIESLVKRMGITRYDTQAANTPEVNVLPSACGAASLLP